MAAVGLLGHLGPVQLSVWWASAAGMSSDASAPERHFPLAVDFETGPCPAAVLPLCSANDDQSLNV